MADTNVSDPAQLQELCAAGQRLLAETKYLDAEDVLARAETIAYAAEDWDTLSRLYMPLQEARRQRRQLCGEGVIKLDLLATGPDAPLQPSEIARRYPQGQLLVAGWGTIAPAVALRKEQRQQKQFAETHLAAVYPVAGSGGQRAVVIVPNEHVSLPPVDVGGIDQLVRRAPPHAIVLHESQLPSGDRKGTTETFAETMRLWEQLHAPFLAMADATQDLRAKVKAYRDVITVDYACELAHQKLSDAARELLRKG
jgi:hypothetical protein